MAVTLKELAAQIGAELRGDGQMIIDSTATLDEAKQGQISFLSNPKYLKKLETTQASAVIAPPGIESSHVSLLTTKDPYYAFSRAVVLLHGYRRHPHSGIHPAAHVDPSASVGEGTVIYPGVYVGPRARIGRDCILYPNAVIYDDCILGDRVTIHACASIGQDGFGYATHKGEHHKIPQTGNVILEDDVEIGANCAIDRATLGSTIIGKGTKFSNLIAIGHGTRIGPHGLLVAQVGIAGSVTIGHHVIIGGQSGVAGHLKIGDAVTIAGQAGIAADVPDQSTMMCMPAVPASRGRRIYMIYSQLPELLARVKQLEQQMAELATDEDAGDVEPE
jgi:UDP-3-O-[3-hydroxymyristoyl] glucosamine N-acyltransferase